MSDEQALNVLDLFREIALAKQRMSVSNPHRLIFAKCEAALWQLSKELHDLKLGHAKSPLVTVESNPLYPFHVTPSNTGVITDIQEGVPV